MTRKELVYKLARHLEIEPVYLAAPTFSYQVGDYIVDRHSNILDKQEQVVELKDLLENPVKKEELELEDVVTQETATEKEPIILEVTIPMEGFQGKGLRNLLHIIYSYQPLIKKALGLKDDLVSDEIITALKQERMTTLDHFKQALAGVESPYIDFDFEKETITFKLGPGGDDPEKVEAATKLFGLANLSARRLKSNTAAKVKHTDNEKYTFRTWLLRLGMIGDEYKTARKVLLQNLSGNSSFKKQAKEEA
jgi:hypothetical protein